ncbi:hypothetical protein [Methylomonas sp. MgM2]
MGGMGSGRRYQAGKDTTDDYRALDIRIIHRDGCLKPGISFTTNWTSNGKNIGSMQGYSYADHIVLDYRHQRSGEEWQSKRYSVKIDWTNCNYGGQRPWFRCPANGCGRRVALLYLGPSGIFACRHCYDLAYKSQRESRSDRSARRADNIRDKLGWHRGVLNPDGSKPKGMHWKTFYKLKAEHDNHAQHVLVDIAKRFGFLERLLE